MQSPFSTSGPSQNQFSELMPAKNVRGREHGTDKSSGPNFTKIAFANSLKHTLCQTRALVQFVRNTQNKSPRSNAIKQYGIQANNPTRCPKHSKTKPIIQPTNKFSNTVVLGNRVIHLNTCTWAVPHTPNPREEKNVMRKTRT